MAGALPFLLLLLVAASGKRRPPQVREDEPGDAEAADEIEEEVRQRADEIERGLEAVTPPVIPVPDAGPIVEPAGTWTEADLPDDTEELDEEIREAVDVAERAVRDEAPLPIDEGPDDAPAEPDGGHDMTFTLEEVEAREQGRLPPGYDPDLARRTAQQVANHLRNRGRANYARKIVADFQTAAGIHVDGIYGGQTRGALLYYGADNAPPAFFQPTETQPYTPPERLS